MKHDEKNFKNGIGRESNRNLKLTILITILFSIVLIQNAQASYNFISVTSFPSGASVYLDGIYQGTTPKTLDNIAVGTHTITLKLTGYQDWSQTIDMNSPDISASLVPLTPIATTSAAILDKFRVGPSVTLRPVTDVIDTNQDAIAELFMNNPSLNDVTLNVDVRVSIPSGIHVSGEGFGQAAGTGVVAGTFSVPPGTARTITIVIKADKSARIGSHTLQFTGLYWPGDNKDNFQPLSLKYSLTVKEPAIQTPTPKETPIIVVTKYVTPPVISTGDLATVTIVVENIGGDAKNIKISDIIPKGFTLVTHPLDIKGSSVFENPGGKLSINYPLLKAGESKTFQYVLEASRAGDYVIGPSIVTYNDNEDKSYTSASGAVTVSVSLNFYTYAAIGAFILLIGIVAFRRWSASKDKKSAPDVNRRWGFWAVSIGHIAAILLFWFVTIISFNDFRGVNNLSSAFGVAFASSFTLVSVLIVYKFMKQTSLNRRIYHYNFLIVISASIVIFATYTYRGNEDAIIPTVLALVSLIPTIFTKIIYGGKQIEKHTENEEFVFTKPIEIIKQNVDIKTAFGYKGATIIYKVKIENNTSDPISDIKVYPYIPDVFLLKEKEKSIALVEPKSSQTATFEIRPTGECGECNVSGRVNYYDMASRKRQDIELETKSLSIVCPMLHGKEISEIGWHDAISNLVKTEESTKEIDIPAESLFTMTSRIIKDIHMYMLKTEVAQNHRLFNGVARFYGEGVKGLKYAAQVEVVGGAKKSKLLLKAWAEKEDALTGFYHGILDEIEKRVNVKEYIDDSIVQYNIHYGDKIGTLVKDSVVQRSTIGASARKCPNCGREVEANEKFCLECGAKL